MAELLFSTHGSKGKITEKGKGIEKLFIKLKGVSDRITWFTDIPDRSAGNQHFDEFIRLWDEKYFADGTDPNAALEYENEYGNSDVVVFEMKKPKYNKKKDVLKFEARIDKDQVLEGPFQRHLVHADNDFKERLKRPSLFIDNADAPGLTKDTSVIVENNLDVPILLHPLDFKKDGESAYDYLKNLAASSYEFVYNKAKQGSQDAVGVLLYGGGLSGYAATQALNTTLRGLYQYGSYFITEVVPRIANNWAVPEGVNYAMRQQMLKNTVAEEISSMTAQLFTKTPIGPLAGAVAVVALADAATTKYKAVINDKQDPWLLMPGEYITLEGTDTRWGISNGVADIGFKVTTAPYFDEITGTTTSSILGSVFFDNPIAGSSWAKLSPVKASSSGLPIPKSINEIESINHVPGSNYVIRNFDGGSFATRRLNDTGLLSGGYKRWRLEINPENQNDCSGFCEAFSYEQPWTVINPPWRTTS